MTYDSESEDCPRHILDVTGDFTLTQSDSSEKIFKLSDFAKLTIQGPNGPQPLRGTIASRPVLSPVSTAYARQQMGQGEHGVWTA